MYEPKREDQHQGHDTGVAAQTEVIHIPRKAPISSLWRRRHSNCRMNSEPVDSEVHGRIPHLGLHRYILGFPGIVHISWMTEHNPSSFVFYTQGSAITVPEGWGSF